MNGDEIRRGRQLLGWSQARLAKELKVGSRTIGNWERGDTDPKSATPMLERLLGPVLADDVVDPIRAYSDVSLLSELLRRASERERQGRNGA